MDQNNMRVVTEREGEAAEDEDESEVEEEEDRHIRFQGTSWPISKVFSGLPLTMIG